MNRTAIVLALSALLTIAASAQQPAWETVCESTEGWHGNKTDPGMRTRIEQPETGVVRIVQDGEGTWGKAAFVVENVNLSVSPILEAKINKVDEDAGYQVQVAPLDWSETVTVIERNSKDGIHKANIAKAINKQSQNPDAYAAGFNLVVIVEGKDKSVWVDNLKISGE
jgi:hypothetical protein